MTNPPRIDYIELPSVTAHELTRAFYAKAFGWKFADSGADYAATEGAPLMSASMASPMKRCRRRSPWSASTTSPPRSRRWLQLAG